MWLGILIITIIVVGFLAAAMGLRLVFNGNAEFNSHACQLDENKKSLDTACSMRKIKKIVDCDLD